MRNPTAEEREEEIERRLEATLGDSEELSELMADIWPMDFDDLMAAYCRGAEDFHRFVTDALKDEIGRQVDADLYAALEAQARARYDEGRGV